MPRADLMGFSRGLVTDQIGVDGGLLELTDGWIDRQGEVRKRGGKTSLKTSVLTSMSAAGSNVFHPAVGGLLSVTDGATPVLLKAGFDPTGTLTNVGTRINEAGSVPSGYEIDAYNSGTGFDDEILMNSGGDSAPIRFGLAAATVPSPVTYRTGTVSITAGSAVVTGSGTTWSTNAVANQYLYLATSTNDLNKVRLRIKSVDSNTQITLYEAMPITSTYTISGLSYAITSVGQVASPSNIFANSTTITTGYSFPNVGVIEAHQGRLFGGFTFETDGTHKDRIRWSALPNEQSFPFIGVDYWQSDAYIDVYPGVGGFGIYGLKSFNRELLILKPQGLFSLVGDLSSDGTDLGASIRIISRNVGGFGSNIEITKLGAMISNESGAYIYDGAQIYNFTTETGIQKVWDSLFSAGAPAVYEIGNRILFVGSTAALVFHMDTKTWAQQTLACVYGPITQYRNAFGATTYSVSATATVSNGALHDWAGDLVTTNKNDAGSSTTPRLALTTHPIDVGGAPLLNGRPKEFFLNGYVTDAASDNPLLGVTLLQGRKGLNTGASSALTVGDIAEGTVDKTHRLNVSGAFDDATSAVRIRVLQSGAASDARIYGMALSYEQDRDVANA